MTTLLFDRHSLGVIAAKPGAVPAVDFDDVVAAAGATHHARFLASSGSTASDVIGSINWTINNTVAWQRGALVTNANGGNSAFFNAASPPTYAQATNVITSATWAAAFVLQADKVQEKFVLLDSGTADGGYSIEVEPDGQGGMVTRQFTRQSGIQVMTNVGAVPTSDAVVLFFLQRSDVTNGGRWFYVGNASGFDLIASDTGIKTFTAVPTGTHYLGAWNVSGGVQAPFQGLMGEVMVWNGSVPNLTQMQTIAAKVQSAVFAQNINAGSVSIGNTLSIEVGHHTNPAEGFTPVKVTDPAAGGGTVGVNVELFQVTGHATVGNYSFNYRIDRGSLMSGTATISYSVTAAEDPGEPPAGNGITLPAFSYQTISDAVPGSNLCWWNPTSGNDSANGLSKANAKLTFSAAQNAIGAGGTIIVAGGHHAVSQLDFTKSGTSNNRLKLFAEPNAQVVLYRDSAFMGAARRTWTWTLVDAGRQIWEGPNVGLNNETTLSANGTPSNAVWGLIKIPNGPYGRPHLQALYWYHLNGGLAAGAFHNPNTGSNADKRITSGGYAGPGVYLPGNGRVRIRMQAASSSYTQTTWPTDGRFGQCVGSNGAWIGPGTNANPNDFEIYLCHKGSGDWPEFSQLLNLNGQSWWHIKGINGACMNCAIGYTNGSENNLVEKCTFFLNAVGTHYRGSSRNNRHLRCLFLSPDPRHYSWREYKAGGDGYWYQRQRSSLAFARSLGANNAVGSRYEHCVSYGFFDWCIELDDMDGVVTFDHCAILNNIDDGLMQGPTNKNWAFHCAYCYIAGGPPWSGNSNVGVSSRDWHWHHCVIDNRWPMLWTLPSMDEQKRGVHVNGLYPTHSGGGNGPMHCRKMWNLTVISSPDEVGGTSTINMSTSPNGHNLPAGRAHEVYNCIIAVIDNKRYPGHAAGASNDCVAFGYLCNRSAAGCQRYDYNCYFRDVPNPVDPFWKDIKDSNQTNSTSHTSLAAFRSHAKKTTSESMYGSVSGAFSGSNSTDGHEHHGVQVNPGFVNLAQRDYRPTHNSVKTGFLNVSSSGWTGASDPHSWKGAVDPNGDGSEIGPQPG